MTQNKAGNTYHHGDLKTALLELSEKLLEKEGIKNLSLRKVAKLAGVSQTAPYRHFANKDVLLFELAQVGFERLAVGIIESEQRHLNDPTAQLQDAGHTYVTLALRYPEMTNLMFDGVVKISDNTDLQTSFNKAFSSLHKIVQNGLDVGIYKPYPAQIIATSAWSLMHELAMLITSGIFQEAARQDAPVPVDSLVMSLGEILFSGLLIDTKMNN
jgi:AcrR family transcriptional regulator